MLPLVHIITPKIPPRNESKEQEMIVNTTRKKKIEVPVHGCKLHSNIDNVKVKDVRDFPNDIPEKDKSSVRKSDKKMLRKENARLNKENKELFIKFNELEELSVKRITKLKEKIQTLQDYNSELVKENASVRDALHKETREELKHCTTCNDFQLKLERCMSDNNDLRMSNNELTEDVNMLKTVIFRLNVQLERYQEKLRKHNLNIDKSMPLLCKNKSDSEIFSGAHRDHHHTPISWGPVHTHTLGPLLDAYQDTIAEKDCIIRDYETEISNFTGKLKEIIEENDILHKKLTEDENCSSKLKVQLNDIKRELKTCKEQNDILIKKCALKQDKIEEVLKCYEAKVEQLKRDYSVAHEQYFKCRTEIGALKEKNKQLIEAQEDFRNERQNYIPVSVHNASVNECKKWYEELKLQYESEKMKLKENLDSQSRITNELKEKKLELEGKILQMEKQIKKMESKYLEVEHNLNEVQLSRSACRKQLHKVMNFAKDMVGEQETLLKALNQRHLENKAVKKIGSDMATKMDSLKSQLKDVQKSAWQEFSTVEQKIQEQQDLIETMKTEHGEEVERLQRIIKEQEEANLLLRNNDNIPIPTYLLFKDKYK